MESSTRSEHAAGHHDPEHVRRSIRLYVIIFAALALLTGLTVFACFGLKLPPGPTIAIAMVIASVKGSLVAAVFMHLLSERKVIYVLLAITAAFFLFLMWLPLHDVVAKIHY
jgi:cytochrome c oxidase subunit 4